MCINHSGEYRQKRLRRRARREKDSKKKKRIRWKNLKTLTRIQQTNKQTKRKKSTTNKQTNKKKKEYNKQCFIYQFDVCRRDKLGGGSGGGSEQCKTFFESSCTTRFSFAVVVFFVKLSLSRLAPQGFLLPPLISSSAPIFLNFFLSSCTTRFTFALSGIDKKLYSIVSCNSIITINIICARQFIQWENTNFVQYWEVGIFSTPKRNYPSLWWSWAILCMPVPCYSLYCELSWGVNFFKWNSRYVEKKPGQFVADTSCEKLPKELCGKGESCGKKTYGLVFLFSCITCEQCMTWAEAQSLKFLYFEIPMINTFDEKLIMMLRVQIFQVKGG